MYLFLLGIDFGIVLTNLITFVIIKFMKTQIVSELTEFIRSTGCSVRRLCLEAGVSPATVSHVLTGRRQDMHSSNADALRAAMRRLSSPNTPTEHEEAHHAD